MLADGAEPQGHAWTGKLAHDWTRPRMDRWLSKIKDLKDLRGMKVEDLTALADEIREPMLKVASDNVGQADRQRRVTARRGRRAVSVCP
jgi:hypothetical protein